MKRFGATVVALVLCASTGDAAQLCLAPLTASGWNISYLCSSPTLVVLNDWSGYDTNAIPCAAGNGQDDCIYGDLPPEVGACWRISSSLTDPFANSGPLPPGEASLYLWLVYSSYYGIQAAEFSLEGDLNVVSVTAMNGSLITHPGGNSRELQIAAGGCPQYAPLALITVSGTTGIDGTSWGRVKSGYDKD
ncbi:MAG TPA: hypothetical protein VKU85_21015 [bacterium]|nr:hypothetical protein [bacterium]